MVQLRALLIDLRISIVISIIKLQAGAGLGCIYRVLWTVLFSTETCSEECLCAGPPPLDAAELGNIESSPFNAEFLHEESC
jgi:hypothetical protein